MAMWLGVFEPRSFNDSVMQSLRQKHHPLGQVAFVSGMQSVDVSAPVLVEQAPFRIS